MKNFNLVYKIKKEKTEKRSGGSSVNDICFNKIKFLKLLPSCKSVNPLQRSYFQDACIFTFRSKVFTSNISTNFKQ